MEVRPLRETDDRSGFRSGDPDLDRFFALYAGQNQFRHHIGTTWVAAEGREIVGFATVSAGHVEVQDLPMSARKSLPRYPLPILRLVRLAVHAEGQGRGVGAVLLRHVFGLALRMADELGCVGVVVDAKPGAIGFYEKYGFEKLEVLEGASSARPRATSLFLSIREIRGR